MVFMGQSHAPPLDAVFVHCPSPSQAPPWEEQVKSMRCCIRYSPFVQAFSKSSWLHCLHGCLKEPWREGAVVPCSSGFSLQPQRTVPLYQTCMPQKGFISLCLCKLPEHRNCLVGKQVFPREDKPWLSNQTAERCKANRDSYASLTSHSMAH